VPELVHIEQRTRPTDSLRKKMLCQPAFHVAHPEAQLPSPPACSTRFIHHRLSAQSKRRTTVDIMSLLEMVFEWKIWRHEEKLKQRSGLELSVMCKTWSS